VSTRKSQPLHYFIFSYGIVQHLLYLALTQLWIFGISKGAGMSRLKISFHVLQQVVADLGSEFSTKDVSEDYRMRNAHLDLIENLQYHGFIGGALSDHDVPLGIRKIRFHHKRGSIWKKTTNFFEQTADCFD